MDGILFLVLLIFVAALPIIPVWVWFRIGKIPIPPVRFMMALMTGAGAAVIAVGLQLLVPPGNLPTVSEVLFGVFIRVALTEEVGRLVALVLLFWFESARGKGEAGTPALNSAVGLLVGLGFALIESASYGAGTFGAAVVRAVTAAPLHGACGARVGMALAVYRGSPGQALGRFVSAVAIHGMYNLMVISPGVPWFLPVLVAFTALFASIQVIRR
jgi:RsiW-degrading membrane proteinase PrsW (M82 family)